MSTRGLELFERAQKSLPGGVSRNTLLRSPHPHYVDRGEGCRVWDVDGVERIDCANNMASLIHGHAHPEIMREVTEQLARGTAFTMATEVEIRFAEHLISRAPSFDKLRFVNSGTEAVMAGLKASRAFTGRSKLAKFEGTYHGAYDYAEVSQAPQPHLWGHAHAPASVPLAFGTPEGVLKDVVVLPFNNPERAIDILDDQKDEIACVLIDPMPHRVGLVPADQGFIEAMRAWTTANGALLMFDEVITFRAEFGGMQSRYGVLPDLTSMGKIIGGGFPVGAIAGREEVMEVFAPGPNGPRLPHSGTFSANPVTMTAGLAAMSRFDRAAVERLNGLGLRLAAGLREAIEVSGAPASVTGAGSMFRVHLTETPPTDYRSAFLDAKQKEALGAFIEDVARAGYLLIYSAAGALSTPMTETEIDGLCDAALSALRRAKEHMV